MKAFKEIGVPDLITLIFHRISSIYSEKFNEIGRLNLNKVRDTLDVPMRNLISDKQLINARIRNTIS